MPSRTERTSTPRATPPRAAKVPIERTGRARNRGEEEETESSEKLNGWAAVMKKQEEKAEYDEVKENAVYDFYLKSGESSVIQFLDDEPYTFEAHSIMDGRKKWQTVPCQLATQAHCLMCREKIKQTWKAAFKVLDYRGKWSKDKKKFLWDAAVERKWIVNLTILGQLSSLRDKRKKTLTEMVLEVSRTGSGKNDTSYNFERALDDDDNPMLPQKYKSKTGSIGELCKPLSDSMMTKMGFEAPED